MMENMLPRDEYYKQKFDRVIDDLSQEFRANNKPILVVGKIYEVREFSNSVQFKLNYYKDHAIKVYIPEDKWNEIKKYKNIVEGKMVKVIGFLQITKNTNEPFFSIKANKVFKIDCDVPHDEAFQKKLEEVVSEVSSKLKACN